MAQIIVKCPSCQSPMQVPDQFVGKAVKCPKCARPLQTTALGVAAGLGGQGSHPGFSPPNIPVRAGAATSRLAPPTKCLGCGAALLVGAASCGSCGFLVGAMDPSPAANAPPAMCINPACGAANAPAEKKCARCGEPIPMSNGTVLQNRYRIDRFLAAGGFGCVYRGTDIQGGDRAVVVKDMLLSDVAREDAVRLKFFRREFEILKLLEKVSIVPRVYDFIHHGKTAHLVIEFIDGKDLAKIMEKNGKEGFPLAQVIEWGKVICDGLDFMHNQQPPLVHRDIKPENIMLLNKDQRSIKMIDFGTARELGSTAAEQKSKKTEVFSQGYGPLEQRAGLVQPRSDLYALAATLFHLSTGKHPADCTPSLQEEVKAIVDNPATAEHQQYRWFFELMKINLADDVNERYFSARDFKTDLEQQCISTEARCPKCQAPNKVRFPYCQKCTASMTPVTHLCASCGKSNALGSRFCIYCSDKLK